MTGLEAYNMNRSRVGPGEEWRKLSEAATNPRRKKTLSSNLKGSIGERYIPQSERVPNRSKKKKPGVVMRFGRELIPESLRAGGAYSVKSSRGKAGKKGYVVKRGKETLGHYPKKAWAEADMATIQGRDKAAKMLARRESLKRKTVANCRNPRYTIRPIQDVSGATYYKVMHGGRSLGEFGTKAGARSAVARASRGVPSVLNWSLTPRRDKTKDLRSAKYSIKHQGQHYVVYRGKRGIGKFDSHSAASSYMLSTQALDKKLLAIYLREAKEAEGRKNPARRRNSYEDIMSGLRSPYPDASASRYRGVIKDRMSDSKRGHTRWFKDENQASDAGWRMLKRKGFNKHGNERYTVIVEEKAVRRSRNVARRRNQEISVPPRIGSLHEDFLGRPVASVELVEVPRFVPEDYVKLGELHSIVYRAKKSHLDNKIVDYEHEFGEEGGKCPMLCADSSGGLHILGGDYMIEPEGIRN
jgi:hypothetical protein